MTPTVIGFSAQASTLGVFFYLNKYASGLGSTNLCEGFFGLIFPTKRIFEPTVLLLKKAARCQPFLAVVRCLFHNHLRLKRSSLLNVYLNYKFEFSLLTSHLSCSLFILVFLRKRRRWAFSLNKYASGLGSTNLSEDSSV